MPALLGGDNRIRETFLLPRLTPTATAGCLNPDALTLAQTRAEFPRQRVDRAVEANHACSSPVAVAAAGQPPRSVFTAVGKQRHFAISQHFNLANNPIPASMLSVPTTAVPQRVPPDSQRIGVFERLGRRVQRI